jgi:hypothetical protein
MGGSSSDANADDLRCIIYYNRLLPYGTGNSQDFCGFLVKIVFLPTIPTAFPPAIRAALKSDVSAKKAVSGYFQPFHNASGSEKSRF